jgi:cardiolipin synthase
VFVEEYLQEVRAAGYRLAAWALYFSKSWRKVKGDAAANPDAVRSILLLALALFGLFFLLSLGLAFATDLATARRVLLWTGALLVPISGALLLHVGLLTDRAGYPLPSVNLPTVVTVLRLVVIPLLVIAVVEGHWRTAFWVFLVAAWSDVADGWLARRTRQETRLGQVLDPITDILFHLSLFVALHAANLVGAWVLWLAVLRYGGLLVGGIFLTVTRGPVRIQSTLPGKVTGLLLGILVGFLLLIPAYGAGAVGRVLMPLAHDGLLVLLAGSVVHAVIMGWFNYRHAALAAEASRRVIRGVRFGD